jgi:ubiquinone/menaquinone biosynthesis C-methylase UbiE
MTDRTYTDQLRLAGLLTEPAIRQAIRAFSPPPGSEGLDVGCGFGLHARWLAEVVGPSGAVTGVDQSGERILVARSEAGWSRLAGRVTFDVADLRALPFPDDRFDWLWCADTLWPSVVEEPAVALGELARVVRPGGTVALVFCTGQRLLPGHPALEAALDRAFAERAPYLVDVAPARQAQRALGWLREAGLGDASAETFVAGWQSPLSPELRASVAFWYEMLWGGLVASLEESERETWARLCRPASDGFLPDEPSWHGYVTYTLFKGTARHREAPHKVI